MASGFERLMKAIEFERTRSRRSVPLAKRFQELLGEKKPFFTCGDGGKLSVDGRDLDRVAGILGEDELADLSLPIYLRTAPSLGHGFYRLLGVDSASEMERKHNRIIFGLLETKSRPYLYSYETQRLKREVPSIIHFFY